MCAQNNDFLLNRRYRCQKIYFYIENTSRCCTQLCMFEKNLFVRLLSGVDGHRFIVKPVHIRSPSSVTCIHFSLLRWINGNCRFLDSLYLTTMQFSSAQNSRWAEDIRVYRDMLISESQCKHMTGVQVVACMCLCTYNSVYALCPAYDAITITNFTFLCARIY